MAAKIKEGMTGGQVADIIEQNFENLENKFQQLSDQFDHTKEDINRTLDEYQSQVDDAYGSIAVQVDEEDTTTDKGKIKFKDRAYEPDKFSGKGYKILRKNIVCNTETKEAKNILTQDMINEPNTVYEIRYDFDLNGETINIPEGCTLKFEGGSLSNGFAEFNSSAKIVNYGFLLQIHNNNVVSNTYHQIDYYDNIEFPIYYVDPESNINTPNGSLEKPFNCVNQALLYTTRIAIKRGTKINIYREFEFQQNYHAVIFPKHTFSIEAYGRGTNPIIDGTVYMFFQDSDVQNLDNNIYLVNLLNTTFQVTGGTYTVNKNNSVLLNSGICSDLLQSQNGRILNIVNEKSLNLQEETFCLATDFSYIKYHTSKSITAKQIFLGAHGIYSNNVSFSVKDITIRNISKHGIASDCCKFKVTNCKLYNIGGGVQSFNGGTFEDGMIQFGNALQIYKGNANVTNEYCNFSNNYIYNVYDAGATFQGTVTPFTNSIIENNIIKNCLYGIEFFTDESIKDKNDVYIGNNEILYCSKQSRLFSYFLSGNPTQFRDYACAFRFGTGITKKGIKIFNNKIEYCDNIFTTYLNPQFTFINNIIIGTYENAIYANMTTEVEKYIFKYGSKNRIDYLESIINNQDIGFNNKLIIVGDTGSDSKNIELDSNGFDGYNYFNSSYGRPVWWNGSRWVFSDGYRDETNYSGSSNLRPTIIRQGFQYFDTTLNKPIWWTGSKWVDATGADV